MTSMGWSTYLSETLTETTLAVTAAIVLVMLLRRSIRMRFGASLAYSLWLLVPASMLAVMLPAQQVVDDVAPLVRLEASTWVPVAAPPAAVSPIAAALESSSWVLPLWLTGVLIAALYFACRQWRFQRAIGRLRRSPDDVNVFHAEAVAGLPAVMGYWKPRIVLPADFELRYSITQRRLMLAHERAHIQRGDLQINALLLLLRCLFWFNPLIHFVVRAFRHDQELACDQRVITRHPGDRRHYGEAMIHTQLAAVALPLGCQWGFSHPLKERIIMLKQPIPSASRLFVGATLVSLLTLGTAVAAWASQPATRVAAQTPPPPVVTRADVAAGKKVPPPPMVTKADVAAGKHVPPPPPKMTKADVANGNVVPPPRPKRPSTQMNAGVGVPSPIYPAAAKQAKIEGEVTLDLLVAVDGTVKTAKVVESSPPGVFDQASVDAAMQWRLPNAIDKSNPVETWLRTPIHFSLASPDQTDVALKSTGKAIREPRPVSASAPDYPETDTGKRGGHVMLRVTVQPDGSSSELKVVESEPPGVFDDTAIAAVSSWTFEKPESGKPTQVLVPVNFAPEGQ